MFADLSHLIARNPAAHHYGIAAFDADADGTTEFFVTGLGCPNRLLKWGGAHLRDIAPKELADEKHASIAAAAADFDGDGREELYVLSADTFAGPKEHPDRLFDCAIDGWSDLFDRKGNRAARNLVSGRSVAAIDRRGTGRYGFFVANYAQPSRLYEFADNAIRDIAPALGLDVSTGGRGLWVGPLVSDRSDLFCTNEQGPNLLYRNTGLGTFLEIAIEVNLADAGEHGRGVAALDADGDGKLDLAFGNWEGPNRLMLRQPNGTFKDRATPAMALPGPVRSVIAADFDNCGTEELFFNCLGEANRLFKYDEGLGTWRMHDVGAALEIEGFGTGACVADIDNDGRLELLLSHGEQAPQPLSLFGVAEAGANWIRVQPLTRHGAPARGALVRLTAASRIQTRVIDGGSGYLCQMEPVAHFGLGRAAAVESVRITWPDGANQTVTAPPIRHTLRVPHPG